MMSRKILFTLRHAPYGSAIAREALDALLATAVFGQDISVLFMDDGVFQLLPEQSPGELPQKTLSSSLSALPLYDVEKLYVHAPSLEARGLTMDKLVLDGLVSLNSDEVATLLSEQDHLLSF